MPVYWTTNGRPALKRAPQRKEKPMMRREDPGAYHLISGRILDAINRYALLHERKGHFLTAVLGNNLREALARADGENYPVLLQIVSYCHNEIPGNCWGSPAKVKAWLEMPPDKWNPNLSAPEGTKEMARQDELGIWGTTEFRKVVTP